MNASRRCHIEDFTASIVHIHDIVPNKKSVIKVAKCKLSDFAAEHRHIFDINL